MESAQTADQERHMFSMQAEKLAFIAWKGPNPSSATFGKILTTEFFPLHNYDFFGNIYMRAKNSCEYSLWRAGLPS
jgi:hypothetical protein